MVNPKVDPGTRTLCWLPLPAVVPLPQDLIQTRKQLQQGFSLVSFVLIDNTMTGICVKCLKVTFEEPQSFKCVYLGRFVQKQPFPHHHLQPVQLIVLYRETTWVRAP